MGKCAALRSRSRPISFKVLQTHPVARLRFLNIARASLAEVGYCIHVALRLGYISEVVASDLEAAVKQTSAPLNGLIRSERFNLASKASASILLIGYMLTWLA